MIHPQICLCDKLPMMKLYAKNIPTKNLFCQTSGTSLAHPPNFFAHPTFMSANFGRKNHLHILQIWVAKNLATSPLHSDSLVLPIKKFFFL